MSKPTSSEVPSFELRDARQRDYQFAKRLYIECMKSLLAKLGAWNEGDVLSKFKKYYELDQVQIISANNRDVGWLQLSETEHEINLDQIYLEEDFRCHTIGTRLIQSLMATAKVKKKPVLLSLVRNNRAVTLYKRLGFKVVAEDEIKLHMRWE